MASMALYSAADTAFPGVLRWPCGVPWVGRGSAAEAPLNPAAYIVMKALMMALVLLARSRDRWRSEPWPGIVSRKPTMLAGTWSLRAQC